MISFEELEKGAGHKDHRRCYDGAGNSIHSKSSLGCAKKEQETKPPASLTVEPLVGIGDVKFGDSKDVIIATFGEPDKIQAQGNELNYVASKGMNFTVDTNLGLQRIKLWSDD